jgi:hypothetical protein
VTKPSPPRDCKAEKASTQATAANRSKMGGAAGRLRAGLEESGLDIPPSQETGEVRSLRDRLLIARPTFNSRARGSGGKNDNTPPVLFFVFWICLFCSLLCFFAIQHSPEPINRHSEANRESIASWQGI